MKKQFSAGAGKDLIQFSDEMFPLEGFMAVHDYPAARILLLDTGEKAAIVCLELVMLPPDLIEDVKSAVSEATGAKPEHVWVHTTHAITTPHAPHAPVGMGGVALEIPLQERQSLERKLTLFTDAVMVAVKQAAAQAAVLRPAKLMVGAGECRVNINRDVETPYGYWIGFNPKGVSNKTATVLRIEDEDGAIIAAFISYGLKPCAIDNSEMEKNTRLVSSDVPGLACTLLEEHFGAPVLFAMSAAGDQVPLEQAWYDEVEPDGTVRKVDLGVAAGLDMVDRLGRQMANELVPIIENVTPKPVKELYFSDSFITWPGKPRGKMIPALLADYEAKGEERVDVLVMTLGSVALVGLRPEVNAVTEAALKQASPYAHTLVLSMVDGGQKYMPDQTSYDNITWEAQSAPFMPGAAEAWTDKVLELLNKLHEEEET